MLYRLEAEIHALQNKLDCAIQLYKLAADDAQREYLNEVIEKHQEDIREKCHKIYDLRRDMAAEDPTGQDLDAFYGY